MSWWRKLRVRARRPQLDRELEEELAFHIEMKTRELEADGVPPERAHTQARVDFGNPTALRETSRELFAFRWLETLLSDSRHTLRALRRSPGFAATAIAVLALGLGANTAIFSVVNAVLLRPLPFPQADRLVQLFERDVLEEGPFYPLSPANFLDWQKQARSFEAIAATMFAAFNLSGPGAPPEFLSGIACTHDFFPVLGVQPVIGRWFTPRDDRPGAPATVVISYGLWQRRFGGDRAVLGRQIDLDRVPHTIIGVAPKELAQVPPGAAFWVPLLRMHPAGWQTRRGNHCLVVFARLRPGVSVGQARAELDGIARRIKQAWPAELTGKGANVVSLQEHSVRSLRASLLVMLAAVGCVLLIACLNVGNLLLARASVRRRELAVRKALGAPQSRLFRHLLTETLILALAGGALGLLLAHALARWLISRAPGLPPAEIRLDAPVLLFTSALSLLTGIVIGVMPAFQWRRLDLATEMKEGTRSASAGRQRGRVRDLLMAAELGVSLVLLAGTGLLLKSFVQLRAVDLGFRPGHLLTMGLTLPERVYQDVRPMRAFYDEVLERVRAVPGVRSAGIVSNLPLRGHWSDHTFLIDGHPLAPGQFLDAVDLCADPEYFRTIGLPLLRGRMFTEAEGRGQGEPVLLISQSMANKFWPQENPIGHYVRLGPNRPRQQVVGIMGDVRSSLGMTSEPTMYFPLASNLVRRAFLAIRTHLEPQALAGGVRHAIRSVDPHLAVYGIMTMEQIVDEGTQSRRFTMLLVGCFALLALGLAAIGLYGVVSYAVAQRSAEIAVRIALGAGRRQILRMVLAQGMRPVAAGIVAGSGAAFLSARLIRSLLFETRPGDPVALLAAALLLGMVALSACLLPAARAARVAPASILRNE